MTSLAPKQAANFLVECKVGRLVQTRLCSLQNPRQVMQVQIAMARAFEQAGNRAVICSDWRMIDVFSPEVCDGIVTMLNVTNGKVQRGAILLRPLKATFNLQVERVLRDSRNPGRRSFRDKDKLLEWLAEVLQPNELMSAKQFLEGNSCV